MSDSGHHDVAIDIRAAIDDAQTAIRQGDMAALDDALQEISASCVMLADDELKATLEHGRDRVADLGPDDPPTASEYLRAMSDAIDDATSTGSTDRSEISESDTDDPSRGDSSRE